MTVRKQFPPRDYETFASSNASEVGQGTSETPSTTDSDKTSTTRYSAAQEAQRLAQGSWADNVFRTPATTATPAASTIGEEDMGRAQNVVQEDPSDPPPIYTPTDTAASTIPSSPTAVRSQPVGLSHTTQRPSSPAPATRTETDEEQMAGDYSPSSPLLGQGRRPPNFLEGHLATWKEGRKNERAHRRKKIAWFIFAVLICLWLMVPSLFMIGKVHQFLLAYGH